MIRGFSANLIDGIYGELSEAASTAAGRIGGACAILSGLVDQIRTELPTPPDVDVDMDGRRVGGRTQFNLRDVIDEVAEFMKFTVESAGLQLTVEEQECPRIWGDRMRLIQAVVNLVKNACRFSPPGGEFTIAISPLPADEDRPGLSCALEVRDTGPGFAPEDAEKVFFAGWTTDGPSGHQGMGLHVVSQVCKEHGAKIELDNHVSKGATFRLVLPVDPRRRRRMPVVRVLRDPGLGRDLVCALAQGGAKTLELHELPDVASLAKQLLQSGESIVLVDPEPGLEASETGPLIRTRLLDSPHEAEEN